MKKRLLWQLYPSYLLITILALLIVAFYTSRSLRLFYQNQVAKNLTAKASLIEEQIRPALAKRDFAEINNLCIKLGQTASTRITIILPSGEVIGDSDQVPSKMDNHADRTEFIEAVQKSLGKSIRFSHTVGKNMMYVAVPLHENGNISAIVRTALPVTDIEEELGRIYKKIILGSNGNSRINGSRQFAYSEENKQSRGTDERNSKTFRRRSTASEDTCG